MRASCPEFVCIDRLSIHYNSPINILYLLLIQPLKGCAAFSRLIEYLDLDSRSSLRDDCQWYVEGGAHDGVFIP
jgi:hypothetical protein